MPTNPFEPRSDFAHENTYRGYSIAALIHRNRLRTLHEILRSLPLGESGKLVDFGCSDGFILQQLRASLLREEDWELYGFDHNDSFLDQARAKKIPRCEFDIYSLTTVTERFRDQFDVVLCLETIEHCGDFRNALRNLEVACKPGGKIVVTVPVEIGLPGLIKYIGKRVLRPGEFTDFFVQRSELEYLAALVTGRDLEKFRQPAQSGWPEHLGFDNNRLNEFIQQEFVGTGRLRLHHSRSLSFGFGHTFVLAKDGESKVPAV
ncbi:MAG: class I SAM-dependent methyltransferase [bacterium]|nr:class I SAM-dependent methyltransferase [bacterium]